MLCRLQRRQKNTNFPPSRQEAARYMNIQTVLVCRLQQLLLRVCQRLQRGQVVIMWKAQSRRGADRQPVWRLDSHRAARAINVSARSSVRRSGLKPPADSTDLPLLHAVHFCNTSAAPNTVPPFLYPFPLFTLIKKVFYSEIFSASCFYIS